VHLPGQPLPLGQRRRPDLRSGRPAWKRPTWRWPASRPGRAVQRRHPAAAQPRCVPGGPL